MVKTAPLNFVVSTVVKVALSQNILENFSVTNINILNHYPEQNI